MKKSQLPVTEFSQYAKCLMLSNGDLFQAKTIAEEHCTSNRVPSVIKAAIAAGSTNDPTWAGNVFDARFIAEAFAASLVGVSAFDTIAADSRRAPLATRVGATISAGFGNVTAEGAPMPVTQMGFAATTLAPRRITALCAVTQELLRGPFAEQFLDEEMVNAVAVAQDTAFVTTITSGASSSASSGTGSANALKDIRTLLDKVNSPGAVPYLILGSTNANALATSDGTPFAKCTPTGGEVAGVPYVVSSAAPTKAVAVDARSLLTGDDVIVLESSKQATLEMSSTPVGGAAGQVALWQANLVGLLASRLIGYEVIRSAGVAVVTGAAW